MVRLQWSSMDSTHKGPVMRRQFLCDNVIYQNSYMQCAAVRIQDSSMIEPPHRNWSCTCIIICHGRCSGNDGTPLIILSPSFDVSGATKPQEAAVKIKATNYQLIIMERKQGGSLTPQILFVNRLGSGRNGRYFE